MTTQDGQRFLVRRDDLTQTRFEADTDAPGARPLGEGQARLAIEHFALTANNITYAAFGDAMKYWQFFPAADAAWGCLPVWGFATVCESRAAGVDVGRRVWGFFPAAGHLVVQPGRVGATGFTDQAAHRQELSPIYNAYVFCDADPSWQPALEGQQAVLRPLFATSFLLDDFLADHGFFGARQMLLSSASSKTALGTAHALSLRRGTADAPRTVGLTSPSKLADTEALGCFDEVRPYADIDSLERSTPTVYLDFAGNAALRRRVHEHFGAALVHSGSIGGTHWTALGGAGGLPGPRPQLFFAPAQARKRGAPPPEGWGRAALDARLAAAWQTFITRVTSVRPPWVRIVAGSGPAAVVEAYRALLSGQADARCGLLLSLSAQPGTVAVR